MNVLIAASSGQVSVWWYVLPPVCTTLLGIAGIGLVIRKDRHDFNKENREQEIERQKREERVDHAVDAVLGREADETRGRLKVQGLLSRYSDLEMTVASIQRTIGFRNGDRRTVMEHLTDMNITVSRIAGAQADNTHLLETHMTEDELRFKALEGIIDGMKRTVSEHFERSPYEDRGT